MAIQSHICLLGSTDYLSYPMKSYDLIISPRADTIHVSVVNTHHHTYGLLYMPNLVEISWPLEGAESRVSLAGAIFPIL